MTPPAASCAAECESRRCLDCATILASLAELLRTGEMDAPRAALELEYLAETQSQGKLHYDYTPAAPETPAAAAPVVLDLTKK